METSRKRLNPLYGILAFILIMAIFLLVFAPMQYAWGMSGLALTELGLLLLSLLAVVLTKQRLREVFPIRLPKLGQIWGTLLLWGGCFLSVMLLTLILMYFFPEGFLEVSTSMNDLFSSTHPFFTFLIVTVMPAICEEAMHRGFIQHTFRGISQDWIVVLCMGLIFGIFHLDPYRFVPTACLGMGLTYVMRKTDNYLLPALFHFINNFTSFLSSLGTTSAQTQEAAALLTDPSMILLSIGSYLLIGALAPILLYAGSYLLKKSSGCLAKPSELRTILSIVAVLLLSAVMLASGFAIIFLNMQDLLSMETLMREMNFFL